MHPCSNPVSGSNQLSVTARPRGPASKPRVLEQNAPLYRALSLQARARLIGSLPEWCQASVAPIVKLLFETGMRFCELMSTFWGDVDWKHQTLALMRSKRDDSFGRTSVNLSLAATRIVLDLGPGEPHQPVLNVTHEIFERSVDLACHRAGLDGVAMPDWRLSARTALASNTEGRLDPLAKFETVTSSLLGC